MTPFRTSKDEQFSRNNSGRKLGIMEEEKATDEAEITANAIKASSPASSSMVMDLTTPEGGILMTLEDSPRSGEDVVKKVRFSDQYKTAVGEFGDSMESCVRTILNTSMEEFHDAHDESNAQKATREGIKSAKNTMNTDNMKDVEGAKSTNDSQAEREKSSLIQPSGNFLSSSQIKIIQDNTKNIKKENRDPEVSREGALSANQRDSNRVLMMVLLESNSGGLTNDLMPLISSGLKKLQEQLVSVNCQSPSSATESAKVCRRSITTMKMSVSSVESYSTDSAATMTNQGSQLASSSSSSSVQDGENSNNGGFLSTIAQAMKHALRSLSGR